MNVEELSSQLEKLQAENDALHEAIAETTETLGTPGWSPADLRDAVGVIERLLAGKDLDMEYDGLAKQVQGLMRAVYSGPRVVKDSTAAPQDPVEPGTNRRHTWDEFRGAGMLWLVNRSLHVFGWAIVVEIEDEAKTVAAYPVRTEWRGFSREREEFGFRCVSTWLRRSGSALSDEADRE